MRETGWLPILKLVSGLLVTLLVFAACGGEDNGEETVGQEQPAAEDATETEQDIRRVTLRLNFTPVGDQAYLFYGVEEGFYEEEGLDLEILDGKGSLLTAQDVDAGKTDFGMAGSVSVAQAIIQGADIVSIANPVAVGTWGLVLPEESPIQDISDLSGKTVLVSAGSPETILLPAAFAIHNVDPTEVRLLSVDAAAKFSTYGQGEGDAVGTVPPDIVPLLADARPSRGLLFSEQGVPDFPTYSIVVRRDTLEQDRDLIAAFLRATFRALLAAQENPEEAIAAQVEARPESDGEILRAQFDNFEPYWCSDSQAGKPLGYHVEEDWQEALDLLLEFGDVDAGGPRAATEFFTNEFFDEPELVTDAECPI